ncbi:hypothetical protein M501DRAFT_1015400 [Patellaria atrata CBS 101060]|uniref:Rhodopsin domain-containing protein n=1 Tax=Patellaria atrata CBS 101060 TaxID=1346257 RepID=A0A9P4VP05_9PEZI|nr:hypothetical protein M501DRAFT_1015400 [Patellaria atrata CBS 101060]
MSDGSDFQRTLSIQSWSLYGVGMLTICLRTYARIHRVGLKGLAPDDYLMFAAAAWYTVLVVCLNIITAGGGSNLFPLELYETFSQEEIQERIKGSKIVVISEQGMLNVIYTLKFCFLFMYNRLLAGSHQQKFVKYLGIYVLCGWVATELAFFFACRPFNGYWAVPPPNPQCTTLEHYAIAQACFNISSDFLMLLIPIPTVIKLKMPLRQKVILALVFSMGIFVVSSISLLSLDLSFSVERELTTGALQIIAAILTKVYNLSDVYDTAYMLWYTREASVAVYVANLPMIWPLLREWFPFLRTISSSGTKRSYLPHYGDENERSRTGHRKGDGTQGSHRLSYLQPGHTQIFAVSKEEGKKFEFGLSGFGGRRPGTPESDERALDGGRGLWGKGEIVAQTTIEVETASVADSRGKGENGSEDWEKGVARGRD